MCPARQATAIKKGPPKAKPAQEPKEKDEKPPISTEALNDNDGIESQNIEVIVPEPVKDAQKNDEAAKNLTEESQNIEPVKDAQKNDEAAKNLTEESQNIEPVKDAQKNKEMKPASIQQSQHERHTPIWEHYEEYQDETIISRKSNETANIDFELTEASPDEQTSSVRYINPDKPKYIMSHNVNYVLEARGKWKKVGAVPKEGCTQINVSKGNLTWKAN